jgi:hypothetical protein
VENLCSRCCRGWVCERHPEKPWPHDDCPGPGVNCPNPACPYWTSSPGVKPLALTPELFLDEVHARRTEDDEPRH